jgi:hypothetical protein
MKSLLQSALEAGCSAVSSLAANRAPNPGPLSFPRLQRANSYSEHAQRPNGQANPRPSGRDGQRQFFQNRLLDRFATRNMPSVHHLKHRLPGPSGDRSPSPEGSGAADQRSAWRDVAAHGVQRADVPRRGATPPAPGSNESRARPFEPIQIDSPRSRMSESPPGARDDAAERRSRTER